MFEGIGSVGNSSFTNESEQETLDRRENEDNPQGDKDGNVNSSRTDVNNIEELITRLQDVENRLPALRELDARDTPIAVLSTSATLANVIAKVNQLIKRDLTINRIK